MSTNTQSAPSPAEPNSSASLPKTPLKGATFASTLNAPDLAAKYNAQAAIDRAIQYENQLDAIDWIVNWEHERAQTMFLNTGKRENNFRYLIGQVVIKHTERTIQREASPWPNHPDTAPQLPEIHPMLGGGYP